MKVPQALWRERMNNLMERRATGTTDSHHLENNIADYKSHISKITIGKTVLDVGCGSMALKQHMPKGTAYLGIDAFPISSEVVRMKIEDCYFNDNTFDTLFCFAVLDGCEDLSLALHHMKRICKGNILFLTGVNIEPDKYHTLKITEILLTEQMRPFKVGYREYLAEKVLLIEYKK